MSYVWAFCCASPAIPAQYTRMHNASAPITHANTQAHKLKYGSTQMSVASDLRKAKQMRQDAKSVLDADAKEKFLQAAARLEKRAGKNASKIGRPSKRRVVSGSDRR